ncbi:MAG: sensor histidine kinase, partial [Anaerolineae bacterium]
ARDMHDGIAQNLAYLLLQVDRALDMAGTDTAKLESQLEKISGVITQNIEELRRHIFNLRPVGLEGRSIFKVIRQMAAEFADQFSIKTDCRIIGAEIDLPSDVEASLYRIFQEALSNIQRHARCRQVWITLKTGADKTVELTLEDDGAGFDPSKITSSPFQYHGLGLVSMQERIRNLGGTLEIESAPGHGTRIRICVPAL